MCRAFRQSPSSEIPNAVVHALFVAADSDGQKHAPVQAEDEPAPRLRGCVALVLVSAGVALLESHEVFGTTLGQALLIAGTSPQAGNSVNSTMERLEGEKLMEEVAGWREQRERHRHPPPRLYGAHSHATAETSTAQQIDQCTSILGPTTSSYSTELPPKLLDHTSSISRANAPLRRDKRGPPSSGLRSTQP
ncbi:unnamed protein product [Cutaneotrichosporon oleaginosum]